MPRYGTHLAGEHFTFADLRTVLACASPRRSGDELAGLAASDQVQRVAARYVLADPPLARFLEEPPLAPGRDEVSRLILDAHDAAAFGPVAHLTVGGQRDWLLSPQSDAAALAALAPGTMPEMRQCAN